MPSEDTLRERLLAAARELLDEEGLEGLSLRSVARRAGVSHGAPLRHFPGLAALRAEVAAEGFRELSETVEKSAAQLPPGAGPRARLRAAGRAYVATAVASPNLFALMFRPELLDTSHPGFQRDAGGAFEQLVARVQAAQDAGFEPGRDTRLLAGCTWAAVHGLASLFASGAFGAAVAGRADGVGPRADAPGAGTPLAPATDLLLDLLHLERAQGDPT